MLRPVLARGHPAMPAENRLEIGQGAEAGHEAGIRHGVAICQQRSGAAHPQLAQHLHAGLPADLFEQLAEVGGVVARLSRQRLQGDLLPEMHLHIDDGPADAAAALGHTAAGCVVLPQDPPQQVLQQLTLAVPVHAALVAQQLGGHTQPRVVLRREGVGFFRPGEHQPLQILPVDQRLVKGDVQHPRLLRRLQIVEVRGGEEKHIVPGDIVGHVVDNAGSRPGQHQLQLKKAVPVQRVAAHHPVFLHRQVLSPRQLQSLMVFHGDLPFPRRSFLSAYPYISSL